MIRQGSDLETAMASVERSVHYITDLPQEDIHSQTKPSLPSVWPSEGRIELKDIVLRYRPDQPDVLKHISIVMEPGDKVGIVGRLVFYVFNCHSRSHTYRTGAGKTSIITALTRYVDLQSGSIEIDGVDSTHMTVQDLRHALCVIPQESVSTVCIS